MEEAQGEKGSGRSAVEREKTKMRERQRRSITTNIFHGLRKHGGYRLSPRADINQVLRHLAHEAGWIVEPDGTTYRSTTPISNGARVCPLCGGGGGGGECSTTASPRRIVGGAVGNNLSSGGGVATNEELLAIYMNGATTAQNGCPSGAAVYGEGRKQQLYLLHEASVSNQNTPAGSA